VTNIQNRYWKNRIAQIKIEHRENMERDLTLDKLFEAVKALAKDKCPGPNGITAEFFVIHWKLVGQDLNRAVLKGIADEELHPDFTLGFIVLLCKKGPDIICQYMTSHNAQCCIRHCS
jgi:hypothetical protein